MLFENTHLSTKLKILHELQTTMCVFETQFVSFLLHFIFTTEFSVELLEFLFKFILLFRKLILKLECLIIKHLLGLLSRVGFLLVRVSHLALLLLLSFESLLKTHLLSFQTLNKLAALLKNRLFG